MIGACLLSLVGPAWSAPAVVEESGPTVKVVATFPVLKDLAERIGGNRIQVTSLLTGLESEHTYTPKPSDKMTLRSARLLVEIGLGMEIWVKELIKNAGNPNLLIVTTSKGIRLIKSRGEAEHPADLGDPHIWLDPENAKLMVRHITQGLISVDSGHKEKFLRNQAVYLNELDQMQKRLLEELRSLRNRKIITHHSAWAYFARRFGFTIRDTIMIQVGTEPSAGHLSSLVQKIRDENIRVIVSEPQLNPRFPEFLAQETGARVAVLTPIPGALPGTETYRSMMEYNVHQLISALKK